MPRNRRPKGHPQKGGGDKRGRHKKAWSKDVQRRIQQWEQIDWRRFDEGEAA